MKKPIIAIVTNLENDDHYYVPGYPRIMLNEDYPRSIEEAGGIPLLIPVTTSSNYQDFETVLSLVDGLVFSGGQDINPLAYSEQPDILCGASSDLRDNFEFELYKVARSLNKPILGICRGMQMINVASGGNLWQDNSYQATRIKHVSASNPAANVHHIAIQPNSFLAKALDKRQAKVNSFHHQSLKDLGEGFKAVAFALDGVVEAMESHDEQVICVQWHPEMQSKTEQDSKALFKYFIEKASK